MNFPLIFIIARWFCHVDDDGYVNTGVLLKLLGKLDHSVGQYVGHYPQTDQRFKEFHVKFGIHVKL